MTPACSAHRPLAARRLPGPAWWPPTPPACRRLRERARPWSARPDPRQCRADTAYRIVDAPDVQHPPNLLKPAVFPGW